MTNVKETWQQVLKNLETDLGPDAIALWMSQIRPLVIESETVRLEVPTQVIYKTIKERYEEKLLAQLASVLGRAVKIEYSMSLTPPEQPEPPKQAAAAAPMPWHAHASRPSGFPHLNPHYTFDSFIVGASNRFAYASAEGVAKSPGQNPFFIYSAPGLGKTHLLHAIAHEILKNNPAARILYTASENFVNEYIDAVRGRAEGTEHFRKKYRMIDCLLLDDIQFLIDKERSEEEFFYTFNALFESKKQVVITSDRPPRELAMGERLVSRFLAGAVADIKLPDFETRVAILRQKRQQHKYEIPDDVLTFIAENVRKSIRELEGCLITVGNFSTQMRQTPTIDLVRDLIKDHIWGGDAEDKKISIDRIKEVVAQKYNVDIKELVSKKRSDHIAYPRHVCFYLACTLTSMTLKEVGEAFGRDHASVVYGRDKIALELKSDPYLSGPINQMIAQIKGE